MKCIGFVQAFEILTDTVLPFRRFKLKNVGRVVCLSSFLERLFYFYARSIDRRTQLHHPMHCPPDPRTAITPSERPNAKT